MIKRGWVLGAALLLLSVPGLAGAEEKLDPEHPTGTAPFADNNLENYTTGMLIAYLEAFQRGTDAASQDRAAKIASFLSQTDANWRVTATGTMAAARTTAAKVGKRLKRTDGPNAAAAPTPTATPSTAAAAPSTTPSPAPAASPVATASVAAPSVAPSAAPWPTSFASDEARQDEIVEAPAPVAPVAPAAAPRTDWYTLAQGQMQSFWEAERDLPGAAPKGKIYDPRTGLLVSLDDHTRAVGMHNAFEDELSNTSSGSGSGTMKRITDR